MLATVTRMLLWILTSVLEVGFLFLFIFQILLLEKCQALTLTKDGNGIIAWNPNGGFGGSCPEIKWQDYSAGIFSARCRDRAGRDQWSSLALSKFYSLFGVLIS